MNTPETSDEQSAGRRRQRVTPRQLWATRRQKERAEAHRPATTLHDDREGGADLSEAPPEQEVFDAPAERKEAWHAADDSPAVEEAGWEPLRAEPQAADEQPEQVESPASQEDAETTQSTPEEPATRREPKMVEPSMQPGAMRYPYATHSAPPEAEDGEHDGADWHSAEGRFSGGLVVGVLAILVALVMALTLLGQHRKISSLQQRVSALEQAVATPERHAARP